MRSRIPRSRATLSVVLFALLGSACSAFSPQSGVQTNQVAIDLAFGAKVDPGTVVEEPPLRPLTPVIIELPEPQRPKPPPPVVEDICPPPIARGAKYIAPPQIKEGGFDKDNPETGGNSPPEDKFLFHLAGNRAGERYKEFFGYKHIDAYQNETLMPSQNFGFSYRVSEDELSGIRLWFTVVPETERTSSQGGTDDGLFLRRLEIPRFGAKKGDDPLHFSPATSVSSGGLRLLHFPIQGGKTFEDESAEVAAKSDPVAEPNGTPVSPFSGNSLISTVRVGGTDIFPVCDQLAQAWKVAVEIRSVGEYRWTMVGTFWLGTHIGGWPIKDDFVFFSEDDKLISGNFSSNLARLDPGDYI